MAIARPLIQYLPEYMRGIVEFNQLAGTEEEELNQLSDSINDAWNNQYIATATDEGLRRYEKIYGVVPMATATLDERRFKLYALMNQELPYTYRKLEESLAAICGDSGWILELNPASYEINIKIDVTNINNREAIEGLLLKMLPANIAPTISILYNPYSALEGKKHSALSGYTHEELRKGVLN